MPQKSHQPHSSTLPRANRNNRNLKSVKTTDSNGWTTVTRGPTPFNSTNAQKRTSGNAGTSDFIPPSALSTLRQSYARHKRTFDSSSCAQSLRCILTKHRLSWSPSLLGAHADPESGVTSHDASHTTKCVCLALGPLSPSSSGTTTAAGIRRSLYQLAALEHIIDGLSASSEERTKIDVYAQDPAFSPLDKHFLTHDRNIQILDPPAAEELVMAQSPSDGPSKTVLYAPHCATTVYLNCLAGKPADQDSRSGPDIVIGNDVEELVFGGSVDGLLCV